MTENSGAPWLGAVDEVRAGCLFELRMRDRVSLLLYLQKHVPAKKLPVETKMNLPSREECEGWDPAQVAFFLGQNKMPECAGTVNRLRIDGHRLLVS
ncbi:hypothetical protein NQZ68_012527 [Dissostichus eleginoides]|nr:hypothetical protein NQZ68_012527 [Dissostichus eleginoides]